MLDTDTIGQACVYDISRTDTFCYAVLKGIVTWNRHVITTRQDVFLSFDYSMLDCLRIVTQVFDLPQKTCKNWKKNPDWPVDRPVRNLLPDWIKPAGKKSSTEPNRSVCQSGYNSHSVINNIWFCDFKALLSIISVPKRSQLEFITVWCHIIKPEIVMFIFSNILY